MAVNVGSLLITLGLESGEFKSGLNQAEKEFKRSTKRIEAIGASMQKIGRNMTLAVTAPLVALGVAAVREAAVARDAMGQVTSALTSMGNVSGKTAEELKKTAKELRSLSTFDDDEILRDVTANLLTFGRVSGEAFDRGQRAAVDMATRLKTDLKSATILVGKALNDPIKGLTALGRSGIQFTEDQKKMIKGMVEAGRIAEAQAIILGELERQFLGAGKAARDAVPGSDAIDKWRDFKEIVGESLLNAFERIEPFLTRILDGFNNLSPGVQKAIVVTAGLAAAMGPLLIIIGGVTKLLAPFIAGIGLAKTSLAAAGIATSNFTLTIAALRAALLTLVQTLGPYALVLAAVSGAIYIITRRSQEGTKASAEYREQQKKLGEIQAKVTDATTKLATATGKARAEAIANAKALRQETLQYLANAKAALTAARAKARQKFLEAEEVRFSAGNAMSSGSAMALGGNFAAQRTDVAARQARTDAKAASDTVKGLEAELNRLNTIIGAPPPQVTSDGVAGVDKAARGSARKVKEEIDRTAEIERRFNDELISYTQQTLSARQGLATSAEERADLELRSVELARIQTLDAIKADEEYNDVQKQRLAQQVETLADYERQAIARNLAGQLEQERADLLQVAYDAERELLALQADVADTQAERKTLAMQILALEQEYRRNMLEMVLASETASDAEKARAQAILDSLAAIEAGERNSVGRGNETDVERYLRHINRSRDQINEEVDGIAINGLERLSDALVDVMVNFESLRDTVQNVVRSILSDLMRLAIQQAIIKPLANAMFGVPGFAKGTNYAPGGLALVGERGPELVNLPRGSQVIPNHELRGMGGQTVHSPTFVFPGISNERQAREAGSQAALRYRQMLNGPVRA